MGSTVASFQVPFKGLVLLVQGLVLILHVMTLLFVKEFAGFLRFRDVRF